MEKWEYKVVPILYVPNEAEKILNQYAAHGWELVCVNNSNAYLKRRLT